MKTDTHFSDKEKAKGTIIHNCAETFPARNINNNRKREKNRNKIKDEKNIEKNQNRTKNFVLSSKNRQEL